MNHRTDAEQAERLSSRRARMLPALAVIFLAQQAIYFTAPRGPIDRPVDRVHIAAWLVLSTVILLALATGGGWIYSRRVRDLANDEATRAHRHDALSLGFFATMAAAIILYFVTLFDELGGREAIHLVMTFGIASALLRFGYLERRAHRGA